MESGGTGPSREGTEGGDVRYVTGLVLRLVGMSNASEDTRRRRSCCHRYANDMCYNFPPARPFLFVSPSLMFWALLISAYSTRVLTNSTFCSRAILTALPRIASTSSGRPASQSCNMLGLLPVPLLSTDRITTVQSGNLVLSRYIARCSPSSLRIAGTASQISRMTLSRCLRRTGSTAISAVERPPARIEVGLRAALMASLCQRRI